MKKILIKFSLCLLAIPLLTSCGSSQPHMVDFYHWKTTYEVSSFAKECMDELNSETFYLHVFDVVKEGEMIVPKAKLLPFEADSTLKQQVVPVVFIMNNVFSDENSDLELLSSRIVSLTNSILSYNGFESFQEIQIDYDWTASTRDTYFAFLQTLKGQLEEAQLSCTIRLHQIKDVAQMGVPPVDKGYLMCYATTNPNDGMSSNSILDIDLLKNYTQNLETYSLPLSYALPLYSWGIVTNHQGKIKLVNGLSTADVNTSAFKKIDDNKYEVVEDGFVQSIYLCKGFTIEIEEITPKLLNEAKSYLDNKLQKSYHIVYYHLSDGFLKRFSIDELK